MAVYRAPDTSFLPTHPYLLQNHQQRTGHAPALRVSLQASDPFLLPYPGLQNTDSQAVDYMPHSSVGSHLKYVRSALFLLPAKGKALSFLLPVPKDNMAFRLLSAL